MHVIAIGRLRDFWLLPGKQDAEEPLRAWNSHAKAAEWANWSDIKNDYPRASWVGNGRVVFDIASNKYRLVVKMEFEKQRIYIRFIGTHKKYEDIEDITAI